MEAIKIHYDPIGSTLHVWFGNPADEYLCEETGEEIILIKDRAGKVIGMEKLNYSVPSPEELEVQLVATPAL